MVVNFDEPGGSISREVKTLTNALSKFNALRKFECIDGNSNRDEISESDGDMAELIIMLAHHQNLTEINICSTLLQEKGSKALVDLLTRPQQNVAKLSLVDSSLNMVF